MKDVFVDNNLAGHFVNPTKAEYRAFIAWLWTTGSLVVTQDLLSEYIGTCGSCKVMTSLHAIVAEHTRRGRLNMISRARLNAFKLPKHKNLLSNSQDHNHIKAVLLSFRRMAFTGDVNFTEDLKSFSKYNVQVADNPGGLDYAV